jgi:hypothetical protein
MNQRSSRIHEDPREALPEGGNGNPVGGTTDGQKTRKDVVHQCCATTPSPILNENINRESKMLQHWEANS